MRIALLATIALTLGACTLKVARVDPMGQQSYGTSFIGSSSADDIQGSLLYRTQAIKELREPHLQQFQDPGVLYTLQPNGVPQLMLDPRFELMLTPQMLDPSLRTPGPLPGGL